MNSIFRQRFLDLITITTNTPRKMFLSHVPRVPLIFVAFLSFFLHFFKFCVACWIKHKEMFHVVNDQTCISYHVLDLFDYVDYPNVNISYEYTDIKSQVAL